jgi:hypothetical protein
LQEHLNECTAEISLCELDVRNIDRLHVMASINPTRLDWDIPLRADFAAREVEVDTGLIMYSRYFTYAVRAFGSQFSDVSILTLC